MIGGAAAAAAVAAATTSPRCAPRTGSGPEFSEIRQVAVDSGSFSRAAGAGATGWPPVGMPVAGEIGEPVGADFCRARRLLEEIAQEQVIASAAGGGEPRPARAIRPQGRPLDHREPGGVIGATTELR